MDIYKQLKQSKTPVIIFGAGNIGRFILECCRQQGLEIAAFCDNALSKQGTTLDGIIVDNIKNLADTHEKMIFIVATSYDHEGIIAKVKSFGDYECALAYRFYSMSEIQNLEPMLKFKLKAAYYFSKWLDEGEFSYLKSLDLVITERCSLKCRECSNLMQYYQHPQNYSVEQLKREIDRVLEIYDYIYELRLIGGEPFVNGNFSEIIDYLNHKSKVMNICIYTNGTICPSDRDMEIMRSGGKTWLSISDYGELSRKLRELVDACKRFGIYGEVKPIESWTRCSTFLKHNRTAEELTKIYGECCTKDVTTLIKGKLYPCPYIANGLNLHALPDEAGNCIDVMTQEEGLREKAERVLKQRKYFSLCDYCNGRPYLNVNDDEKIPPHEQTPKPLPYQRFD